MSLHETRNKQNQKLRELLEKRIEIHESTNKEINALGLTDGFQALFKACQSDMLNELQTLLKESKK